MRTDADIGNMPYFLAAKHRCKITESEKPEFTQIRIFRLCFLQHFRQTEAECSALVILRSAFRGTAQLPE